MFYHSKQPFNILMEVNCVNYIWIRNHIRQDSIFYIYNHFMEFVSYEKVHHQLILNQISNTILFYNRDHPEAILVIYIYMIN